LSPWPWKHETVKKCAVCGKHVDETEQTKVYGDGVHSKKTYYCSDDCWSKRGIVVGSKLDIGCKFYDKTTRMCSTFDLDSEGNYLSAERVPCSLQSRNYLSCNVYPILEERMRIFLKKQSESNNVGICCAFIDTWSSIQRMHGKGGRDELGLLNTMQPTLSEITDINTRSADDRGGMTVLHCAARKGYPEIVKVLLAMGADVNARTRARYENRIGGGKTLIPEASVLEFAIDNSYYDKEQPEFKNRKEVVKLLLSHGAQVNPRTDSYCTPLYQAVEHRDTEIVKQLIAHGADVNPRASYDEFLPTPLMLAIFRDEIEIVRLLLEAGADLKAREVLGNTPLHLAARTRAKDMVKLLVDYGADVNAKNSRGESPIQLAKTDEIKKLLEGSS
jgi:ankyrin repeat protein